MFDCEDLPSREAHVVGPPGEKDGQDRGTGPTAQRGCDREREDQRRKCQEDVGDSEDDCGNHASEGPRLVPIACNEAEASPEQESEAGNSNANGQVKRKRREDSREDVKPQLIGPQKMLQGRRLAVIR